MSTDVAQRMLDLEAIRTLMSRYARLLDWRQWDEWAQLWSEDARLESPDIGMLIEGRDAIVSGTRSTMERAEMSVHLLFTSEIDITTPDTAHGIWRVEDHVRWTPGPDGVRSGLHGFGKYDCDYVRQDGEWRLVLLRIGRLYVDRF